MRRLALAFALTTAAGGCAYELEVTKVPAGVTPSVVAGVSRPAGGGRSTAPRDVVIAVGLDEPPALQLWTGGEGGLRRLQRIPMPEPPRAIAAVDADGRPPLDLVIAHPNARFLTMVYADQGGFRTDRVEIGSVPRTTAVSTLAAQLSVADLDGDGRHDVIAVQPAPPRVVLLHGREGRGFKPPLSVVTTPGPNRPPSLATVDLDRDGRVEIVCSIPSGVGFASAVPDHLRVLRNGGLGRLADETMYEIKEPGAIVTGDIDADGWADVLVTGRGRTRTLYGLGGGWLSAVEHSGPGRGFDHGLLVDLDGDQMPDFVGVNKKRARLAVFVNLGDRHFAPPTRVDLGGAPTGLAAVDVDGDGRPELVTADATSKALVVVRFVPNKN